MQSPPALLVTGASGLIGRALAERRSVLPLSRRQPAPDAPWWDPAAGDVHGLDSHTLGAVVHLAGENVGEGRWTAEKKARIRDSRVQGTRTLVSYLQGRTQRPEVLVSASAVGIYGDRGDQVVAEDTPAGTGFLAEVAEAWEAEADRAADVGIRVVKLRIGIVLAADGGALAKMLPPFRLGAGGPLGSGKQWFPWVHLEDVVGAIEWALTTSSARGVYNLVAPEPVRQKDFARALGAAVGRPAVVPAPAFALRLALGEFADEGLLAGQRCVPARLREEGYAFRQPALADALKTVVG
ncbi:MAG: TIGR01777 family oxidoreductase [Myxococcota bacterium]|nr:TIGR01777 family oxidoreductase [Myxococcota bacterium]